MSYQKTADRNMGTVTQLLLMADMMLTLEMLSQKYFLLKAQEKKLKFINRKKLIRQNCPNN
ncbi:unnamed protein product [Callosobruchus maculatus]|uniref:Uncharacterized protein n=1 Tax=Callosobruchus maculatus TaxID=64391 RepID=A0A653CIR8_CALMS|nr:unnamed protein product [Callosobruchus maculatus]